jgi:hypothetical protein
VSTFFGFGGWNIAFTGFECDNNICAPIFAHISALRAFLWRSSSRAASIIAFTSS